MNSPTGFLDTYYAKVPQLIDGLILGNDPLCWWSMGSVATGRFFTEHRKSKLSKPSTGLGLIIFVIFTKFSSHRFLLEGDVPAIRDDEKTDYYYYR